MNLSTMTGKRKQKECTCDCDDKAFEDKVIAVLKKAFGPKPDVSAQDMSQEDKDVARIKEAFYSLYCENLTTEANGTVTHNGTVNYVTGCSVQYQQKIGDFQTTYQNTSGTTLWGVVLSGTQSGGDVGGDFNLIAYKDGFAYNGSAILCTRKTGYLSSANGIVITNIATASLPAAPGKGAR